MSNRICVEVDDYVELLAALADPTRLRLLSLISRGRVCVCHLQEVLATNQPKISRHLKVLREAGLVAADRQGKWMYYYRVELTGAKQRIVVQCLSSILSTREVQRDFQKLQKVCCAVEEEE